MNEFIIPNWHPLLVHFTIALLSVSALLFALTVFIRNSEIQTRVKTVAVWNFWIGAGVTLLTLLAGWQAFNSVAHDEPSHLAMIEHRNWALITAGWLSLMAIWLLVCLRKKRNPISVIFAIVALVMLGLLGTTAWHGAELVYRHGLGVLSLPAVEVHGHSHGHTHSHHAVQRDATSDE